MTLAIEDWRQKARRRLPQFAFDYLDGGAGSERCLERNRDALDALMLVPDALCNVTDCNTKTVLLGHELAYPLIVAPTGLSGLFWHDGDVALARAASRIGIPSVISTASTSLIADVAAANPGQAWFQLYVFGEQRTTESLLRMASDAGCNVLMLTVDAVVNGNRTRDIRNGFTVPFKPSPRMLIDMLAHPRWLLDLIRFGAPELVNVVGPASTDGAAARAALVSRSMDRALTWKRLEWLRERWSGPLVLKGILRASDARRATESGVDAIVVSNHGGRQLDSAPATIDALPAVLDATGKKIPVLIDSGFRSGTDVVKALALGADAVLLGRPLLYALAAGGEKAVHAVLGAIVEDLARTLRLLGVSDSRKLRPDHVQADGDKRSRGGLRVADRESSPDTLDCITELPSRLRDPVQSGSDVASVGTAAPYARKGDL